MISWKSRGITLIDEVTQGLKFFPCFNAAIFKSWAPNHSGRRRKSIEDHTRCIKMGLEVANNVSVAFFSLEFNHVVQN